MLLPGTYKREGLYQVPCRPLCVGGKLQTACFIMSCSGLTAIFLFWMFGSSGICVPLFAKCNMSILWQKLGNLKSVKCYIQIYIHIYNSTLMDRFTATNTASQRELRTEKQMGERAYIPSSTNHFLTPKHFPNEFPYLGSNKTLSLYQLCFKMSQGGFTCKNLASIVFVFHALHMHV